MVKSERIKWIDSLKGLACIIVIITHIIAFDPQIGMYANGCGKIGVWLFMLISGMLYAKSSFHQSGILSFQSLMSFYRKKIIRIYPSYFFALTLMLALKLIGLSGIKDNLSFQSAWGHLWYIPVILKFYLIAPFFTFFKCTIDKQSNYGSLLFCLSLILIGILLAIVFPYPKYPENSIQLYWYLPVFIIGIILGTFEWNNNQKPIWFDIGAIIGIVVILIFTPLGRELLFGEPLSRYLQNKYLLIGGCWVLVIIGILYGTRTKQIVEGIPGLSLVSKYSFELYLIHYIILYWISGNWPMETWLKGLLTIASSFVITVLWRNVLDWITMKMDKTIQVSTILTVYIALIVLGYSV